MAGHSMSIRGFARGALTDADGTVHMGDWHENAITETGFEKYIIGNITHATTSQYPTHLGLSSAAALSPSSASTALSSEFGVRAAATVSVVASKTLRMVASWAATDNTGTIGGVGVFYNSTTNNGSAGSIAAFASSIKSNTQTFAITYDWRFA